MKLIGIDSKSSIAKFAAARSNGDLVLYDASYEVVHKFDREKLQTCQSKVIGLCCIEATIVACTQQGSVALCSIRDYSVKLCKLPKAKELEVFKPNLENANVFGYGGKELDVKIVKIEPETGECNLVFEAKNVKNDRLDMRQPIWITDLEFLPAGVSNCYKLVTVTRYGQLRVYETSSKKQRPVINIKISDRPLSRVLKLSSDMVVVTDNHMSIFKYNISSCNATLTGKYGSGNTGAVQALFSDGTSLTTGGLDRYLRVFNIETRHLEGRIFLGNHITDLIMLEGDQGNQDQGDLADSDDEVWKQLEKVDKVEKRTKRRKVDSSN